MCKFKCTKVGNEGRGRCGGERGDEGRDEHGDQLARLCAENMFLGSTFLKHKQIHRHTQKRAEDTKEEQRS